ncbi:MAG: hypothetical protein IKR12_00860 [Clostridia bacterium]|nr:hypothetical protein [Clostridia bacterium]
MSNKEKIAILKAMKKELKELGIDVDKIGTSGVMTLDEQIDYISRVRAEVMTKLTSNSTRVSKSTAVNSAVEYIGFDTDDHSQSWLKEFYFELLGLIGAKCFCLGDDFNGDNLAGDELHHKAGLMNSHMRLSSDILARADLYKRYPGMFIGTIEGNHDQWSSEYTGVHNGKEACKIAGIDEKYADNIQIVTRKLTYNGKEVPFNFLIIHGVGMSPKVLNALKPSLSKAMSYNVDAILFGHTHKMGSASINILNKDGRGNWVEKQVTTYNPGTILETSDYADKAGYSPNKPYDGTIMRCQVVEKEDPKTHKKTLKKVIDFVNIMELFPEDLRKIIKAHKNKLAFLETRNYESKEEITEKYSKLLEQYKSKNINITQNNGHYFIGISGTSDLYSPYVSKDIKEKIRQDLKYAVEVAQQIPNVSVVLNGDLIYDYNKGHISKKDCCADIIADIQDLTEILKPVADKVVVINNGKMENDIMDVEHSKAEGRIGGGKNKKGELARYATHVLQLDKKLAYAPYDKQEMLKKQISARNDQILADNDAILSKAYDDYMKKKTREINNVDDLEEFFEKNDSKGRDSEKKIKDALVKKLRKEHQILDISNPEDKDIIDERYPISAIDLRKPNENLIGNIICKMLGSNLKKISVNSMLNFPATFKFKDEQGKTKIANTYYCTSVSKLWNDLKPRLSTSLNPADVVILNNSVSPSGTELQEWTSSERINYKDKNGKSRSKDVVVFNSGSFAYSKYLSTGRVPTNMVYKVVDVDRIFKTLVPKHSIHYAGDGKNQVVEIFNYETVLNKDNITGKMIAETTKQSYVRALEKHDAKKSKKENAELVDELDMKLNKD